MYRWIEHTAELELAIEAPSREGVFEDALVAFADLTRAERGGGEPAKHVVVAEAACHGLELRRETDGWHGKKREAAGRPAASRVASREATWG